MHDSSLMLLLLFTAGALLSAAVVLGPSALIYLVTVEFRLPQF